MKINRAYEVLKGKVVKGLDDKGRILFIMRPNFLSCVDEELRKKYDLYGEDGLKDDHFGGGQNYQSWHYFNEEFGKQLLCEMS